MLTAILIITLSLVLVPVAYTLLAKGLFLGLQWVMRTPMALNLAILVFLQDPLKMRDISIPLTDDMGMWLYENTPALLGVIKLIYRGHY